MKTISAISPLRNAIYELRKTGKPIALVPTMGALHAGHLSLVEKGLELGANVVASIFVNPKQFGANEDLGRYPRQEEEDARLLAEAGCALLFLPKPADIYPDGFATNVSVRGLDSVMEGASRPGHFDGVATVVTKLLTITAPDYAIFGEKDWQQLAIIRRFSQDLNLPVEIVGAPIIRDSDGLALSSRNAYLSADERQRATSLPQALEQCASAIRAGENLGVALETAKVKLAQAGFVTDYLILADESTLQPIATGAQGARLFVAARLGTTRLIDNMPV